MEPEAHDETDHEHRLRVAEFMQYSNTANFQALQDQSELLAYFQNHCILCGKFHLTPKAMMHHWTIDHVPTFLFAMARHSKRSLNCTLSHLPVRYVDIVFAKDIIA